MHCWRTSLHRRRALPAAPSPACSWVVATPSLFGPAELGRLFESLRGLITVADDAEITLEANPATVERGRFAEYRSIGINRVSLGAQSFIPETLRTLGRIHQPADVPARRQ